MSLEAAAHDLLFREARTHNKWQDKPVTDEQIHELYELLKYGPTSANSSPAAAFLRARRSPSFLRCATRSNTPTTAASCTATSSPRTSSSTASAA